MLSRIGQFQGNNTQVRQQQRSDPEKELQDYMKKHNCSRAEAQAALQKAHGGKAPTRPQNSQNKQELSPMEMQKNVKKYMAEHKCSEKEAAQALGYPPPQPQKK